jgi:hypothetical protein
LKLKAGYTGGCKWEEEGRGRRIMLLCKSRQQDLRVEYEGDRKKWKENYDVGERADTMGWR